MRTLNRQRANIVLTTLFESDRVLRPEEVSKQERIFERDGVLRWEGKEVFGRCRIGVSFSHLLRCISYEPPEPTGKARSSASGILELYRNEEFLSWYDFPSRTVLVALKEKASPVAELKAWAQALFVADIWDRQRKQGRGYSSVSAYRILNNGLDTATKVFDRSLPRLLEAGWDIEHSTMETAPGQRISIRPPP